MATSTFDLDDQTDEDFFDRLVNDDDDDIVATGSVLPTAIDELKSFSNLTTSEVDSSRVVQSDGNVGSGLEGEKVVQDGVDFESLSNNHEEVVVAKEESSNGTLSADAAVIKDKDGLGSEKGAKVVQWSSFSSDLPSRRASGVGSGSYSDFLNELGGDSDDPFANVESFGNQSIRKDVSFGNAPTYFGSSSFGENQDGLYLGGGDHGSLGNAHTDLGLSTYGGNQDGQYHGSQNEQSSSGQVLASSQYWDNLYPAWWYDQKTGQWHQVEGYDANVSQNMNASQSFESNTLTFSETLSVQQSDSFNLQQNGQSAVANASEGYSNDSVSKWKQNSDGNMEYPAHMVFDPQYPGWYYDTIAQEWKVLDTFTPSESQSAGVDFSQEYQNKNIGTVGSQSMNGQEDVANLGESVSNGDQQNREVWERETYPVVKSEAATFAGSQKLGVQSVAASHVNNFMHQQAYLNTSESLASYDMNNRRFDSSDKLTGLQSFDPSVQFMQHQNQTIVEPSQQMNASSAYFTSKKQMSFNQQYSESSTYFSHPTREARSSDGRPPHALVTFGFGGTLILMKDSSSFQTSSAYEGKEPVGRTIKVLNLMEVLMGKANSSSFGIGDQCYFHSLCQQTFPGPLLGGSVRTKDLNKWIDEQITNCESSYYKNGERLKLLFSLLRISCQHYGKLRLPFVADQGLKENDGPESAVAKLFASSRCNIMESREYLSFTHCLQNIPSEAQIQATALQVQKLLVSGKKNEALECAQEGQLWGPALVLAYQLGDQFYGDTVKKMALKQIVAGSPLRTLCLLMGGNPVDVFSNDRAVSNLPVLNTYQQPEQTGASVMLDEWEENLAIITANRTKGDELVLTHLGDCLWKDRADVMAAHLCYLVAEANFEPYSDSARLCLIGADHLRFPRTYADPDAIQRTELYEYSKVLGNSQFVLLPFQPYKVIYAHMLAEVGKVADSLKYCQAILKSLKTGQGPEVDTWRQVALSLEDRLKTHQQGGYGYLAPPKLVDKLFTLFDSTTQRVVGPPPVPSTSPNSFQHNEYHQPPRDPKIPNSRLTMSVPSLVPSVSMEPINELVGEMNQPTVPNRSISEPDIGRTPEKVQPLKQATSANSRESESSSTGSSRFGRFGSQLFQKTFGLVLRPRSGKQAKLGESNKFYYDENLKTWVEEGAEPPKEAALPPPPPTAAFQNMMPNHNGEGASETESFHPNSGSEHKSSQQSSGIPLMPPPSMNQFSAQGRGGIRSRYVDPFNKGGQTQTSLFQSPSVPATRPKTASNPKFFIPTPVASDQTVQKAEENTFEVMATNETAASLGQEAVLSPLTSLRQELVTSPPSLMQDFVSPSPSMSSPVTMHRFPSMDNIVQKQKGVVASGENSNPTQSRRVASWNGISNSPSSKLEETKPLGNLLGVPPSSYMPNDLRQHSSSHSSSMEELHEIQP